MALDLDILDSLFLEAASHAALDPDRDAPGEVAAQALRDAGAAG
jgi:hypothetical protein